MSLSPTEAQLQGYAHAALDRAMNGPSCSVCGVGIDPRRDMCFRCDAAWLDEDRRIELRDDHAYDHDETEDDDA